MEYINGAAPTFKGLPLPEGVDRHNLYSSAFRVMTTYAMPLADLDDELKAILKKKDCTIKFDDRKNFIGKLDVVLNDGKETLVHVMMDTCGATHSSFCQLKCWVDY